MEQNELQEYNYPDYIIDSLRQLMESSMSADKGRLRDDASIVSLLYNTFNNYPITPQVYSLLWSWLLRKVRKGHDAWVKNYWSLANQYYTFKLEHAHDSEMIRKQKEAFKEFHLMVGVMLLHYEKYDILNYIFSFTNTLPPKYPLLLGTFHDIFITYRNLSELNERLYLLKYNFYDVFNGAGEEKRIEGCLANFIALLLVRLEDVKDYNITYSNPLELPILPTDANIDILNDIIDRIEFLCAKVSSTSDSIIKSCGITLVGKATAIKLLDAFKSSCLVGIDEANHRSRVSEEKRRILKQSLIKASREYPLYLPMGIKKEHEEYIADQTLHLDERLILDRYGYISSNTGEALINALNTMVQHRYCLQFIYNGAAHSVGVPYSDLGKALEKLNLSPDYSILAMGISYFTFREFEGFSVNGSDIDYKGCKVHEIPSNREQSFIIMRAGDIPTISVTETPSQLDHDEMEIDAETHLYSNIDSLNEDNLDLKVKKSFKLQRGEVMRYVRIRVAARLESDPKILQSIKPINEYI